MYPFSPDFLDPEGHSILLLNRFLLHMFNPCLLERHVNIAQQLEILCILDCCFNHYLLGDTMDFSEWNVSAQMSFKQGKTQA